LSTALFFSRDPGPTNQLVAVHAQLASGAIDAPLAGLGARARGLTLAIHGKPPGDAVWRRAGIEPTRWQDDIDDAAIDALLARLDVALVITGTSDIDEPTDRRLWRAAARRGIESHVFLDHPANLDRRFVETDGTATFPTRLYAPGDCYRAPRAAPGLPAAQVLVGGDLHLARLARQRDMLDPATRRALRKAWGAEEGMRVVLYASECNAEMTAAGRPSAYDEFLTLDRLIAMVRAGETIAGISTAPDTTLIVVRPHPRDRVGKYDDWRGTTAPRVTISPAGAPLDAVRAADLVTGMDSTLLREALTLECPTVSLVGAPLT
jgi:hypothetical protein